jgi:prophage maintenance system killer protein
LVQITKGMIMVMHEDLIRTGGQIHGVLCEGTIDYFVDEINSVPGVYAKAARALYMSRQHPFFDGNKRTSFVLAATILKMSGHYLGRKDEDEIIDALQKISDTEKECDIRFIEVWLKRKSKIWFKARQRTISDYL